MRPGVAKYWAWFVFVGALLAAPNLLSVVNTVRLNHFSWLDAFATCALLFGPAILIGSLAGSVLLALLEKVTAPRRSRWVRALPSFITLTIFLAAWLRLLRGMLKFNHVDSVWVDRRFELGASVVIAALVFMIVPGRLSRWVAGTGQRLRPVSWACAASLVGLIGFILLEPLHRGATAPVQLPEPGRQQPNVIVVVLDGLTSLDMSLYGYALPTTPRLDELTRTWTVFENAHTAATATAAFQPAILTGRYPYVDAWHHYGDLARAGSGWLSLPRLLQASGYRTIYAMGGGWPPSRYHLHTGFDRIIGGGFPEFQRPRYVVHTFPGRDRVNRTLWNPVIAEALLSWRRAGSIPRPKSYDEPMYNTVAGLFREQAEQGNATPFFLHLHAMRPHHPYFAGEFLGRFLPIEQGLMDLRSQSRQYLRAYKPSDQPIVDKLRLRYNENILKADQELGRLVDTLKQLDLYDQSLIIFTSDHGSNFIGGYQGYFSPEVRAAEHRIPLLVKFPGQSEGRRIDTAVSTVDILPTILDVIGARYPAAWVDGQSLRAAEQAVDRIVYVTRVRSIANIDFDHVAAIRGDLKLVRRKGREFLFNLADDPEEKTNLLGRLPAADLREALDQFVRRAGFVRDGGNVLEAPPLTPAHP